MSARESNPGTLRRIVVGIDHNRANSSTVAPEKRTGHYSGNHDVHANTVGGTKTNEFVTDSGTATVTALSHKNRLPDEWMTAPGEAGPSGEACVANTLE